MKLNEVVELFTSKYLSMYKLKLTNKKGNPKDYFIVSRRDKEHLTCLSEKKDYCDGVMILPITKDNKIIMVKQYRPAINDYIYELPAGIVDPGETIEEAAKRELYEETGLKCISYEMVLKPSYSSVGITDETTAVVKMIVEGEVSTENLEDDEELEVLEISLEEAKEFVKNNNVSMKAALILTYLYLIRDYLAKF